MSGEGLCGGRVAEVNDSRLQVHSHHQLKGDSIAPSLLISSRSNVSISSQGAINR
jgi:hypothetical protein